MRGEAVFSTGMTKLLDGAAIGDEFVVQATARIISAEEVLIDITGLTDSGDPEFVQGELKVTLLLSHAKKVA
jgi:hypothetical protein